MPPDDPDEGVGDGDGEGAGAGEGDDGLGAGAAASDLGLASAGLLSPAGAPVGAVSDFVSALLSLAASFFLLPLSRKSVTYQPLPFNWNPAAVTCLVYVAAPHAGHTVNGASEIFCNTSCACPQVAHL